MEPAEFLTMQDIAVVTPEGFFRVERFHFINTQASLCNLNMQKEGTVFFKMCWKGADADNLDT